MGNLDRDEKFIIRAETYLFFLLGMYSLTVGAIIPLIREEYGISYELSGYLISANSIGYIAMSLIASYSALLFGLKRAYILQHAFVIIGLIIVTVSGNPALLLIGMAFVGMARGSLLNYSNGIVNDITKSNPRIINFMGVCFAFGACLTPYIVLLITDNTESWKNACYVVSIAAVIGIGLTFRMRLGNDGSKTGAKKLSGLSFFMLKKYWLMIIAMFCYFGTEMSMIGWTSTYFQEEQGTTAQFASIMATLLWVSILVGRVICSLVAKRISTAKLICAMSVGITVFMALFISNISLPLQVAATICLGLFMAGTHSTIIADTGPIFRKYEVAFGYFFLLGGLGPVVLPAVIGIITERYTVHHGMRILAVAAIVLLGVSIWNVFLEKRSNLVITE